MSSLDRALISHGFSDVERSRRFLAAPELADFPEQELLSWLSLAADPDVALRSLVRMLAADQAVAQQAKEAFAASATGTAQSLAVVKLLGSSEALVDFLIRGPQEAEILAQDPGSLLMMEAGSLLPGADAAALSVQRVAEGFSVIGHSDDPDQNTVDLRRRYRRGLTQLALADLSAPDPLEVLPHVAAQLADLAGAALEGGLAIARRQALEKFSAEQIAAVKFSVIGMGKAGARELNYISDVDVLYLIDAPEVDPEIAHKVGTFLASALGRILSAPVANISAAEPGLWPVDANLRPEGKEGPLVRTVESYAEYYRRWAHNWEFQALLKARYLAGDQEVAERFLAVVDPLVWAASQRDGFVDSVQAMRRRILENIPAAERGRQLKLGAGGLRDVEFTVQLLQLVHGKAYPEVQVQDTLAAIEALGDVGLISRQDARQLDAAYRYLRLLEHRIQLVHLRRTHLMPVKDASLRALARNIPQSSPYLTELGLKQVSSASELKTQWQQVQRKVRALHEQIFYRPLLASAAELSAAEADLNSRTAQARLAALGYRDPRGAMRHIDVLKAGVSRRAALQRQLLPVLLGWLARGLDPDAGLLAFRRLSEALGNSPWYLGMLRDSSVAAERLCQILSTSRFCANILEVSAESTAWLSQDSELRPVPFEQQWREIRAKISRHLDPFLGMRLVRLLRQRETLRIGIADTLGLLTPAEVSLALSDTDRAAILGALHLAEQAVHGDGERLTKVLVVAMGRQGGQEISYGSDADVLYVHEPLPGVDSQMAQAQAEAVVTQMNALLTKPMKPAILAERVLSIDADLRPEGKQGLMVRSLEGYQEYYAKWSLLWEAQALLRARPIAGDDVLAEKFISLIDPVRYPRTLDPSDITEIQRLKARMESERLPRGVDPKRHVKLGPGGLSDVEWLVQLLQLQHAAQHPELRTTSTLEALAVCSRLGLLTSGEVEVLSRAWSMASRIRAVNVLYSGKASDLLPTSHRDLEAVSRWLGNSPGRAAETEQEYLRLTRRARRIFEQRFYEAETSEE